jgi:S-DNA-T family DNA segregation ATPase FtsK/SpoIIIE
MSRVNKLKDPLRYEITGIALLAISVLTLLSVINPSIGLVGGVISSLLMRLAGEGRYLVPVFLTVFGLKMLLRKSKVKTPVNLSGALIIAVVVLTLLHFTVPAEYALKSGLAGDGGGLIGGLILFPVAEIVRGVRHVYHPDRVIVNRFAAVDQSIHFCAVEKCAG